MAVKELFDRVFRALDNDSALYRQVKNEVDDIFRSVTSTAATSQRGYCTLFIIPFNKILLILDTLALEKKELQDAFRQAWDLPMKRETMASFSPYHVLLTLIAYGLHRNDMDLARKSLFLLLAILWNGRLRKAIQYCDPDTMAYVTQFMMPKQSLVHKFETPFALLYRYYTPTLLDKYGSEIRKDPVKGLKKLFNQAWARLWQLFYARRDTTSDTPAYKSGLAVKYYEAKEKGATIKAATENVAGAVAFASEYEDKILNILLLNHPNYSADFKTAISKLTLVKPKLFDKIAKNLHDPQNEKAITGLARNAIEIIFRAMKSLNTETVCHPKLYSTIQTLFTKSRQAEILSIKRAMVQNIEKIIDLAPVPENLKHNIALAIIFIVLYQIRRLECHGKV